MIQKSMRKELMILKSMGQESMVQELEVHMFRVLELEDHVFKDLVLRSILLKTEARKKIGSKKIKLKVNTTTPLHMSRVVTKHLNRTTKTNSFLST